MAAAQPAFKKRRAPEQVEEEDLMTAGVPRHPDPLRFNITGIEFNLSTAGLPCLAGLPLWSFRYARAVIASKGALKAKPQHFVQGVVVAHDADGQIVSAETLDGEPVPRNILSMVGQAQALQATHVLCDGEEVMFPAAVKFTGGAVVDRHQICAKFRNLALWSDFEKWASRFVVQLANVRELCEVSQHVCAMYHLVDSHPEVLRALMNAEYVDTSALDPNSARVYDAFTAIRYRGKPIEEVIVIANQLPTMKEKINLLVGAGVPAPMMMKPMYAGIHPPGVHVDHKDLGLMGDDSLVVMGEPSSTAWRAFMTDGFNPVVTTAPFRFIFKRDARKGSHQKDALPFTATVRWSALKILSRQHAVVAEGADVPVDLDF